MEFVIITGLSGAGKSQAIDAFEDAGYFAVDNLPPQLLPTLADLFSLKGSKVERAAVVSDVRGGAYFAELERLLGELEERGVRYTLVFLEASDEVLIRRFTETRRRHPLAEDGTVLEGISKERALLGGLREKADLVVDTSELSIHQLKALLNDNVIRPGKRPRLVFAFVSFGYKYGIPIDADLLFDVRFLPNPYWDLRLKPLSGLDEPVRDYVLGSDGVPEYLERLTHLLDYLFPRYVAEGKAHLTIGIGCTGGRHRAVTIAAWLADHYRRQGYETVVRHRDIARE
jgi:RNase adapter protein RapZ